MNYRHNKPIRNNQNSPITVESVVEIPARTSAVFAYLANLENNPHWNWAVTETRPLDGAPRTGSRYMQSHSSPKRSKEILEITSYREGEHLEVTSKVDASVVLYRYDLSATSDVGTRLRLAVDLHSVDRVSRPDLFSERLVSVLDMNLHSLRAAILESEEPSTRSGAA
jgi:hypothetical protein